MIVFLTLKKIKLLMIVTAIILICSSIFYFHNTLSIETLGYTQEEITQIVDNFIKSRNKAIMEQDLATLQSLYNTSSKLGTWAYEHEVKKMKYLHTWSEKQGVKFSDISCKTAIRRVRNKGTGCAVNLLVSTEYKYAYENDPNNVNSFKIGTYHILDADFKDEKWIIMKEWYTDPFADSLNPEKVNTSEIKPFILENTPRDFSQMDKRRIAAVEYADQYSGAASEEKFNFQYNKKYKDYNPQGGDCANFASQILFEGGKFRKNGTWNYARDGSKAWVNAQAFKNYMVSSGRASVLAYGNYNKVYKASYKMLPGDFVAYEKKGKITHISVFTGADSKGYSLVNCHNTDRYRVPWDLGWSDSSIKFWLVRVHY